MEIKNDCIEIKIGNKKYEFKNLILDTYLKKFVHSQLYPTDFNTKLRRNLKTIGIKFDEPIKDINEKSEINILESDIVTYSASLFETVEGAEKTIYVDYRYNIPYSTVGSNAYYIDIDKLNIEEDIAIYSLEKFKGKKIAQIFFASYWIGLNDNPIYIDAILDVSNFNIYIQENQDIYITRKDIISTDAIFYYIDNELIKYPEYLSPIKVLDIFNQGWVEYEYEEGSYTRMEADKAYSQLYSIGFSNSIDKIEKEFINGKDFTAVEEDNKLKIINIENKYLGSLIYPNINIFPSLNLYPLQEKFKYIVYKYKLFQDYILYYDVTEDNWVREDRDTRLYYLQAKEIDLPENKNVDLVLQYDRI